MYRISKMTSYEKLNPFYWAQKLPLFCKDVNFKLKLGYRDGKDNNNFGSPNGGSNCNSFESGRITYQPMDGLRDGLSARFISSTGRCSIIMIVLNSIRNNSAHKSHCAARWLYSIHQLIVPKNSIYSIYYMK